MRDPAKRRQQNRDAQRRRRAKLKLQAERAETGTPPRHIPLADWLSQLPLADGRLKLMKWQREELLPLWESDVQRCALTVARGAGKTTAVAALVASELFGPRARPGETAVTSVTADMASIMFESILAFAGREIARDSSRWRVQNSQGRRAIEHRSFGTRVRVVTADPARLAGLQSRLIVADEPGSWERARGEAAFATLRGALGKTTGSRLVALGTDAPQGHFWPRFRSEPGCRSVEFAAPPDSDPFCWEAVKQANPGIAEQPELERTLRAELEAVRHDSALEQQWRSQRLNQGDAAVAANLVLQTGDWLPNTADPIVDQPPVFFGLDPGSGRSMAAIAGFWPRSGTLLVRGAFAAIPTLEQRSVQDSAGDWYLRMKFSGELAETPGRVTDVGALLEAAVAEWGQPLVISTDWFERDLVLDTAAGLGLAAVVEGRARGGHAAQDLREFRAAALAGELRAGQSPMLMHGLSGAVIHEAADGPRLARGTESGRRLRHRDDAVSAVIRAVSAGRRWLRREASSRKPAIQILAGSSW